MAVDALDRDLASDMAGIVVHEATIADFVANAEVSPMGYVSCPLPPFNSKPCCGRITCCPKDKRPESQNISCKCYMHTACATPAKRRPQITDAQLLTWLFRGHFDPTAKKKASGADHMKLFSEIAAASVASASASSSGAAAASSSASAGGAGAAAT